MVCKGFCVDAQGRGQDGVASVGVCEWCVSGCEVGEDVCPGGQTYAVEPCGSEQGVWFVLSGLVLVAWLGVMCVA